MEVTYHWSALKATIILLPMAAMKSDSPVPPRTPPYGLRLPPDLKERIAKAAQESKRSMNAEIVARLEASFGGQAVEARLAGLERLIDEILRSPEWASFAGAQKAKSELTE